MNCATPQKEISPIAASHGATFGTGGANFMRFNLATSPAILTEAGLSFLGLGVQPPEPSWGRMLFDARGFLDQAWWMSIFPGAAVFVTVLACNLVGDALRDVLDVRTDTGGKP